MKVLVDYRMKKIYLDYFKEKGFECIKVKSDDVYAEVSGHPDIFFTVINGELFKAKNVNISHKVNVVLGENVEKCYPSTAKYNICVNNKYAIGNFKYVEKSVKEMLEKGTLEMINVNQGYTRCSLFSIDENHYITSDLGIKKVLEEKGLKVIFVENDNIKLLGKDGNYSNMQGFIGGALAKIGAEIILFGDISKLKNGEKLRKYITSLGYSFKYFENEDIIDYGSVIVI